MFEYTCMYSNAYNLFSAIIPFIIIVAYNINTFVIIHRRQRLSPRLRNRRAQALNDQAARQSYVLLAILVVYGLCHIPSFLLGKYITFYYMLYIYQRSADF